LWPLRRLGWRHTLNQRPGRQTARFYVTYGLAHVVDAAVVLASFELHPSGSHVGVLNALLLPVVLGLLLALDAKALPPKDRMHGWYRITVTALCLVVIGLGLFRMPITLGWVGPSPSP